MLSCQSARIAPGTAIEPVKRPSALTAIGENFDAHFSPDGHRLLFVSRGRPSHLQAQIYELDLITHHERRITFQDGDTSSPRYDVKAQQIFYVSATDELKENPIFLQKQFQSSMVTSVAGVRSPWEMMPTDIYSSELNGDKIQRLTNQRGFDGEIAVHPNGRVLYFSSLRSGHLQLYSLDLKTRILTVVSKDPSVQDIEVAISPDGKSLAWVEYAQDFKTSQIVLGDVRGQKIKNLTDGMGLHLSPSWTPDGNELVFSANSNSVQVFQIYIIKKDGSCLRPLTHDNANASKPSISPDGQSLLYTSSVLGKSQLFLLPYHSPPCLEGAK